jgi:hypothetical protein
MTGPYGQENPTPEVGRRTALGYQPFRFRPCRRTFSEHTGTPSSHLQAPTDIALVVVLWRLRYKPGLRDLAECVLDAGLDVHAPEGPVVGGAVRRTPRPLSIPPPLERDGSPGGPAAALPGALGDSLRGAADRVNTSSCSRQSVTRPVVRLPAWS